VDRLSSGGRARRRRRPRRRTDTRLVLGGTAAAANQRHRGARTKELRRLSVRHRGCARVPVLMPVIAGPDDAPLPGLRPEDFMAPARTTGFTPWPRAVDSWHRGGALPARPIVISFDDGYRSAVGTALPVLSLHGWPGVLNLPFDHVGSAGLRPRGVRRLIAAGWEVDAHTITHAMTTLAEAPRARGRGFARGPATSGAKNFFCHLAGCWDDAVIAAVRRAGYLGPTTSTGSPPSYSLDRVRVNGSDGVDGSRRTSSPAMARGGTMRRARSAVSAPGYCDRERRRGDR
jgi:hypothetical protein